MAARVWVGAVCGTLLAAGACNPASEPATSVVELPAAPADGGSDAGTSAVDASAPDAGAPDSGLPAGVDAGVDAGFVFGTPGPWPSTNVIYRATDGILESPVVGFSTDESQNR